MSMPQEPMAPTQQAPQDPIEPLLQMAAQLADGINQLGQALMQLQGGGPAPQGPQPSGGAIDQAIQARMGG